MSQKIIDQHGKKIKQDMPNFKELGQDRISQMVTDLNVSFVQSIPKDMRLETISTLMALSFEIAKGEAGVEFVKAWIEDALVDINENPEQVGLIVPESH